MCSWQGGGGGHYTSRGMKEPDGKLPTALPKIISEFWLLKMDALYVQTSTKLEVVLLFMIGAGLNPTSHLSRNLSSQRVITTQILLSTRRIQTIDQLKKIWCFNCHRKRALC